MHEKQTPMQSAGLVKAVCAFNSSSVGDGESGIQGGTGRSLGLPGCQPNFRFSDRLCLKGVKVNSDRAGYIGVHSICTHPCTLLHKRKTCHIIRPDSIRQVKDWT